MGPVWQSCCGRGIGVLALYFGGRVGLVFVIAVGLLGFGFGLEGCVGWWGKFLLEIGDRESFEEVEDSSLATEVVVDWEKWVSIVKLRGEK